MTSGEKALSTLDAAEQTLEALRESFQHCEEIDALKTTRLRWALGVSLLANAVLGYACM